MELKKRTERDLKKKPMKNFKIINLFVMIFAITIIFSFPKASEGEVIANAKKNVPQNTQEYLFVLRYNFLQKNSCIYRLRRL